MVLADGVLGQQMEPVVPQYRTPDRIATDWAATATGGVRAPRVVRSLHLQPHELEEHNRRLQAKYAEISRRETRFAAEQADDAEILIVAYGTAARVARTACERARAVGLRAGIFRPITLWPFPSDALAEAARRVRAVLVLELSSGQLVEDVRLAIDGRKPVFLHGRTGGMIPTPGDVVEQLRRSWALSDALPAEVMG
jgi:2-oxoglutarate ferredoxin oxidoreductase subunit alpha